MPEGASVMLWYWLPFAVLTICLGLFWMGRGKPPDPPKTREQQFWENQFRSRKGKP